MQNGDQVEEFNPRKWNAICWVLLLIWLAGSVIGNYPFESPSPDPFVAPNGTAVTSFEYFHVVGMPFWYLETRHVPNKPPTKTLDTLLLLLNIALISATLVGIIYSVQVFIPKFSIRTIFVVITLVALIFALGRIVSASQSFFAINFFAYGMYFSPIATAVFALIYSKFRANKPSLESPAKTE